MAKTNRTRKLWVVKHNAGYLEVAPSRQIARVIARSEGGRVVPVQLTPQQTKTLYSTSTK